MEKVFGSDLWIEADLTVSGQYTSTIMGEAAFNVADTILNPNLNADLLDGYHGTHYLDFANATNKQLVADQLLTGWTLGSNLAVSALDTIKGAFGKVQAQINALATSAHAALTLGTSNGLSLAAGQVLSIGLASAIATGALASADFNTFNNKQNALAGTGIVKSTGGTISYITDNSVNWNAAYGWGNHTGMYFPASVAVTDFNAITGDRIFNASVSTPANGLGAGQYGGGIQTVAAGNPDYANQLLMAAGGEAYTRTKWAGVWGTLNKIITTGNHTTLTRGTGLTGSNYTPSSAATWSVDFGTSSGTVAQGNDSRINNGQTAHGWGNHAGLYVLVGRLISAGAGISGGGSLAADRTISFDATWGDARYALVSGMTGYVPTSRTVTLNGTSGRITSSTGAQDFTTNRTWTLDLASAGTSGTYRSVTTDAYGRVVSGTNPTTFSGYGITDLLTQTLTGYTTGSNTVLTASHTILNAFRDLQAQITAFSTGLSGYVPAARTLTINGTGYDLSANRSWSVGTVTSVNISMPTGFSVGSAITSSGNISVTYAAGYSLPSDATQAIWAAKQAALSGTGIVKSNGGTIMYVTDNSANWDLISTYNSGNTDITALVSGTTVGSILYNVLNGHVVVALRSNDANDSFNVLSSDLVTSTMSKSLLRVRQSGLTEFGTSIRFTTGGQIESLLTTGTAPLIVASTTLVPNLNVQFLNGQAGAYYLDWNNFTNKPSTFTPAAHTLDSHSNVTITSVSSNQLIRWSGSAWVNWTPNFLVAADLSAYALQSWVTSNFAPIGHVGSGGSAHANATTSVAGFMSATDKVKLDASVNYTHPTGDGNLHVPATSTTNDGKFLKAGSTAGAISWQLVAQSDVTGLSTALSGKENTITAGTTAQYWRGDKSWQTLNTLAVPELTNLYYTDARARAAISATGVISYNPTTGQISYTGGSGSGTVTSVGLTLPTGLSVTPSSITSSGTFAVSYTAGYAIPTTAKQTQWDAAYAYGPHSGLYFPASAGITDLNAVPAGDRFFNSTVSTPTNGVGSGQYGSGFQVSAAQNADYANQLLFGAGGGLFVRTKFAGVWAATEQVITTGNGDYVTRTTAQTVSGQKTFTGIAYFTGPEDTNLNTPVGFRFVRSSYNPTNAPAADYFNGITVSAGNNGDYANQLLAAANGDWWVRTKWAGTWGAFDKVTTATILATAQAANTLQGVMARGATSTIKPVFKVGTAAGGFEHLRMEPSDYGTGKGAMSFVTNGNHNWSMSVYDGATYGTIDIIGTLKNNSVNVVSENRQLTIFGTTQSLAGNRTWTMSSGDVTGALGFTPYNSSNPSGYISSANVTGQYSITGGGSAGNTTVYVSLVNDSGSPGNSKLYGTNGSGVKGWYDQPSGGGGSDTWQDVLARGAVATTRPTVKVGTFAGGSEYLRLEPTDYGTNKPYLAIAPSYSHTWTIYSYDGATFGTIDFAGTLSVNGVSVVTSSSSNYFTNKSGNISQWTNDSGYMTSLSGQSAYVYGSNSITGGGNTISGTQYLSLVGDTGSPGSDKYYGTNSGGSKGWYSLPSGGGGGISGSGSSGQFAIWNGSASLTSVSQVTMSGNILSLSDGISASWMQFANYSTSSMTSLSVSSTTLVFNYELNTFCFRNGGVWYKFTGVATV